MSEYKLDSTDRKILEKLQIDCRTPFTEIAEQLKVSHGTIHQRVDRLRSLGVIRGMSVDLDSNKMGLPIVTLIGVVLEKPAEYKNVLKRLEGCPEVSEAYYTTGNYSFIMKVHTASIQHLHHFLTEQVQKISIVRSTETMVVMDTPIQRQLSVAEFKDRI